MVNWFHPPLQTKVELRAGDTVIAVVRSARQLEPEQLHISIAPLPLPCPSHPPGRLTTRSRDA